MHTMFENEARVIIPAYLIDVIERFNHEKAI